MTVGVAGRSLDCSVVMLAVRVLVNLVVIGIFGAGYSWQLDERGLPVSPRRETPKLIWLGEYRSSLYSDATTSCLQQGPTIIK